MGKLDTTKRKKLKRQNLIQFGLILLIIVLVNYIASVLFFRLDLTSEKRYTLSDKTVELLENLDDIIYVKVYLEGDDLAYAFSRLRNSTKELLDEFRVYGEDNIQYEFINPSANPDVKQRNDFYKQLSDKGLVPTTIEERDEEGAVKKKVIFPGAMITYRESEMVVNLLKNAPGQSPDQALNNSIQDLEYELSNAMRRIQTVDYQKIGFLEGHGELDRYQVGDITKELSQYYYVDRVRLSGHLSNIYEIKDYAALIIAKPDSVFSEQDKFILDQYVMNGGKILWLLDLVTADLDSLAHIDASLALYQPLGIEDMLFRYGARINPKLLIDMQCATIPMAVSSVGNQPKYVPVPCYFHPLLISSGLHPINKNLDVIKAEFPASIDTVGQDPAVKKTFLLHTSKYTKALNIPARYSMDMLRDEPDSRQFNKSFLPVAVLLEGTFTSNFRNRSKDMLKQIEEIENIQFKDVSVPTRMIVVADGDIIRNDTYGSGTKRYARPLGQDKWIPEVSYNGNKQFLLNAVNYLCDDSGLMSVRARELKLRMLDKVKVREGKIMWQMINVLAPVILIIVFGLILNLVRKRKYSSR